MRVHVGLWSGIPVQFGSAMTDQFKFEMIWYKMVKQQVSEYPISKKVSDFTSLPVHPFLVPSILLTDYHQIRQA